jgi:hypothetical protein
MNKQFSDLKKGLKMTSYSNEMHIFLNPFIHESWTSSEDL